MATHQVISFTKDSLSSKLGEIAESVEANGFVVLEPWDSSKETLKIVGSIFGKIQSHIRASEEGIVGVGGEQPKDAEWQQYRAEYHGLGTGQFAPHTDGTFVDGLIVEGITLRRIGPPLYVILQVVQHADRGGASIVVDCQKVLKHLLVNEPKMAATLMTRGCITFCRDDQLAMDHAVFELVGYGHFKVRYRGDSKAYAPTWALPAVQRLQTDYHLSPEFRSRIDLKEGQILVADNTRVLHGREPFSNEDMGSGVGRKLRRIWILDESTPNIVNLNEEVATSRALDPFKPYGPVKNDLSLDKRPKIDTGIRLDPESMAIAEKLLKEASESVLKPRS